MAVPSTPKPVDPEDPAYVVNPVTSERYLFHTSPDEPGRAPLAFDIWAAPEMPPLATHVHPRQSETFEVHAGTLALTVDGDPSTLEAGDRVTAPPNVPHTWEPTGGEELHVTITVDPGLATEQFLRDLAALGRRGAVGEDGAPSLLWLAALHDAYGYDLLRVASPPLVVQKVVFGLLAPIARMRGYRARPVETSDG